MSRSDYYVKKPPKPKTKVSKQVKAENKLAYSSWAQMLYRCYNTSSPDYNQYGGRGITVSGRWRHSFKNFLEDMGSRPPGTSIDRIDGDGNYEPGNCRWATPSEQSFNRKMPKKYKEKIVAEVTI
jgi:hypothetical protein